MLKFQNLDLSVDTAALKSKTEAYLVEYITTRLGDMYLAKYGEQILADIDHDELIVSLKKAVLKQLHENSTRGLRDN